MKAKILVLGLSLLLLSLLCLQPEEKETQSKVEGEIKAIPSDESFDNEPFAKYISIPGVKDDGSTYRIWMYLLFYPVTLDQARTWANTVCKSSKRILDDNGVVRDIEVWAIRLVRTSGEEGSKTIVYGRTFYDHCTNKFEFKKTEELNYKRGKREMSQLEAKDPKVLASRFKKTAELICVLTKRHVRKRGILTIITLYF